MIAAGQTTTKASRRNNGFVVLLLFFLICEANHCAFAVNRQNASTTRQAIEDPDGAMLNFYQSLRQAYAVQANQQNLSGIRKKSLEEEAAEIEKDFGVKVVQEEDGLYCAIPTGEYTNYHYGFRVMLPQGLQGLTAVPPHPHHGFFIRLAREPEARITVYAEYNSAVYESLGEVVASELKTANHQYLDFEIIKRKQTKLQNIPAVQLIAQFKDETTTETMMSEQLIALKQEAEEDSGIIYIFRLDTPKSRYKEDRKKFKQMINSWRGYSEIPETEIKN